MKKEFRKQAEHIVSKSGINSPLPENLDFSSMPPVQFIDQYSIDYLHSLGQDSPFFVGLKYEKLLGTLCKDCNYKYATPRGNCMYCGKKTEWFELPQKGVIHAFTVCYFGSEKFLKETPFVLILVKFEGVDTLFLSRLKNIEVGTASFDWIGMKIEACFSKGLLKKNKVPKITDVWFVPEQKS